ncbi:MAG TPA: ABC transporter permease [Pyrinomonadaceae bacterium]|jgi:lipooligosaccharide transport system permease protein|nr:ABC transporter permease [Pyrinomonadaceae bacterium]
MSVRLTEQSPKPLRALLRYDAGLALRRVNVRDALSVWQRNLEVYLRLWKILLIPPLVEPVFSIFAFGWGVGSLILAKVEGIPYLSFVGAGLLAFTVIMRALFETTYGSYFRMVYQSTYDSILATPVEVESLACAEISWAVTKASFDSIIILLVLVLFGAATSPYAALVPLPLMVGSLFIAALSLGITAHTHDIDSFNVYLAVFFSSIFLCGAWFPLEVLPAPLRWLAWAIPLTSAVDLTRAFLTGRFLARHLFEALYLMVAALLCSEWALRSLRRRMVA